MEAVLAVIVGLVIGSGLAAAVAIPLRRRRRMTERPERVRRLPLHSPRQRQRAAIVAASLAIGGTIAMMAGWTVVAGYFMLAAIFLGAQAATSAVLTRTRH